jgi:hypothetical protein
VAQTLSLLRPDSSGRLLHVNRRTSRRVGTRQVEVPALRLNPNIRRLRLTL